MSSQHTRTSCVVITGATRGIGFGLAQAFLALGWQVVIAGRDPTQLQKSLNSLATQFGAEHIAGQCCDVTHYDELQALWRYAQQRFQLIDVWINNAGGCTAAKAFQDIAPTELEQVLQTNVLGTMFGAQVAFKGMTAQGFGQIFNMEGWGSRGEWSAGMTAYATTKRAIGYFSHALYKEAQHSQIKIGTLSPGMVATDLLISSWQQGDARHWRKMKWLFMFVIDSPETVCRYLAQRVSRNSKSNVRIVWMSPWRLMLRFFQPYYWRRNPVQGTALDELGK